jgi:hypothetical protein
MATASTILAKSSFIKINDAACLAISVPFFALHSYVSSFECWTIDTITSHSYDFFIRF